MPGGSSRSCSGGVIVKVQVKSSEIVDDRTALEASVGINNGRTLGYRDTIDTGTAIGANVGIDIGATLGYRVGIDVGAVLGARVDSDCCKYKKYTVTIEEMRVIYLIHAN